MPDTDFTPDPKLQALALRAAEGCVRHLRSKFGKVADYSDAFVAEVESTLEFLWYRMPLDKPSQEDIEEFATVFGSYLGETYRRNHGGEWGTASGNAVALRTRSGVVCYPWGRVLKRLTNGPEDNVHHWYLALIRYDSEGMPVTPPSPPAMPPPLPPASPPAVPPPLPSRPPP